MIKAAVTNALFKLASYGGSRRGDKVASRCQKSGAGIGQEKIDLVRIQHKIDPHKDRADSGDRKPQRCEGMRVPGDPEWLSPRLGDELASKHSVSAHRICAKIRIWIGMTFDSSLSWYARAIFR
jgi:hypothetical protein